MSKFCGNCGTVMDDAAVVCGNCGAPLAASAPDKGGKADVKSVMNKVTGNVTNIINGVKSGDKNALIKGGVVVVAAVLVLILVISLFSGGGEEKVVKKLIKAIDKDKPESIVKLIPEFRFGDVDEDAWMSEKDEGDWEDYYEDELDEIKEYMDEAIDSEEFSISYDIVDTDVYGEDYLENISEYLEGYDDFDEDKLKKAVGITVETTFKKGGEKYDLDLYVVAIKYGAKWYLYSYNWDDAVTNDKTFD